MSALIETPADLVEACAAIRFPPRTDALLQSLMDRNTDGTLTAEERAELQGLVELSESISLIRAKALRVLGRVPT